MCRQNKPQQNRSEVPAYLQATLLPLVRKLHLPESLSHYGGEEEILHLRGTYLYKTGKYAYSQFP
jgi:hypothetical protein